MSIATELERIQTNRNTIRTKLVELGLAQSSDKLDALASAISGITDNGAVSVSVQEGETYTIPKGYHNGSGTVSGVAGGGNYSLQSKIVTPTKAQQNVTPDAGYYGLSDVTVAAIPENYQDVSSVTAAAGDVLTGKVIVTAAGEVTTGTMPNNGAVSKVLTVTEPVYTIPKGFHSGTGSVSVSLETKSVTPTKSSQTVSPTTGKLLSSVSVEAIPDNFIDPSDATAADTQILDGETAYVGGVKVEGTMPNNGAVNGTIDGISAVSFAIPAGYTSGGSVTLTGDIEQTLAAI